MSDPRICVSRIANLKTVFLAQIHMYGLASMPVMLVSIMLILI